MAYYTEISIDNNTLLNELFLLCEEAHRIAVEKTFKSAKMSTTWKKAKLIELDNNTSRIVTDSVKAFINAFGSGDEMLSDDKNPYLEGYMKSKVFNPLRINDPKKVYYRGRHTTYDWGRDSRSLIERGGTPHLEGKVMVSFKGIKPENSDGPFEHYKRMYMYDFENEIQRLFSLKGNDAIRSAAKLYKVVIK